MTKFALIVEDHPIYRDALKYFTDDIFAEFNVTAVAVASAEEALAFARNNNVLLVLLDLGLPGLRGAEAVGAFKRLCPASSLIVISASDDRREVDAVLRAGAKIFISKAASTTVIADIVKKVLTNEQLESSWITLPNRSVPGGDETPLSILTPRQRQIMGFVSEGFTNKEIGLRLDLAEITVKKHVTSVFRTLGVVNRTQAILAYQRLGLGYAEETGEQVLEPVHNHKKLHEMDCTK